IHNSDKHIKMRPRKDILVKDCCGSRMRNLFLLLAMEKIFKAAIAALMALLALKAKISATLLCIIGLLIDHDTVYSKGFKGTIRSRCSCENRYPLMQDSY
ncbi:hypothetical protein MKW98_003827, partial [Papaver atlanticum]